jgi:hydroxymethylpyrimidine pyrophosphatase-like HAD family hydrolase
MLVRGHSCAGKGPEWQFIDLLPRNAGKGSAMRYMQQQLGFEDAATVAAGDANNDLLMLQQVRSPCVVPLPVLAVLLAAPTATCRHAF